MHWNMFCVVSCTDANVAKIFKVYTEVEKQYLEEINAHEKRDKTKPLIINL